MKQNFIGKQGKTVFFIGVWGTLLCIIIALLAISVVPLSATEDQDFPEEIVIDKKVYKGDRKGSVMFSHLEHADSYEIACDDCHHRYKDGENIWEEGEFVKKCNDCHDPVKSDGNAKKLSSAFHGNCKGCHKKLAEDGGTDAPYRKCTGCHESVISRSK